MITSTVKATLALIASRLRQRLRLLFQQLVQGFLHAAADQFLDLPLDNFLIQLYNFLGHSLLSPFECLCGNFILPEPASYVFFFALFNLRNLLYIIAHYLINSMMHLAIHYITDIPLPFFKYRRIKNVPAFEKAGTSRSADIEI